MEHGRSVLKFEANNKTELQPDSANYICTRCGKPFASPIFAVNNSPGIAEGYYACPTCLSKVEIKKEDKDAREAKAPLIEQEPEVEVIQQEPAEEEEPATVEMKEDEPAPSSSSPASPVCRHYMGYLKKRPKGAPMPDECYTCALMLDCMH